jgi:hypothetical protein
MFRSTGTLRYSPKNGTLGDLEGKWWCVLDCDEEIGRYYRSLFNWENRARFQILRPAWGAHISVISNEMPPNRDFWQDHEHEEFEFSYEPELMGNGEYWWIRIHCEQMLDLRERLGLKREPFYPLHLTIGRIKENY